MSDLAATNCGCGSEVNNGCSSIIWIILLLCFCGGNKGWNFGSGNGSCGCGCDSIWIILLLLCCCGGNGGCGCF
ncbi:MAG: chorion class high-cysteine HCB protein 13 [bacterium]|nr:chorion class high-cysteine HCB protein 13 [bacterium]